VFRPELGILRRISQKQQPLAVQHEARGMLERPSAPMLLVNGERDSQQPIADLYLLMKHGDAKDVWVNPQGGHMGRSERWPDARVRSEVVEPWVLRHLENRGQSPISKQATE